MGEVGSVGASVAAEHIKPDPAQWRGLVKRALDQWVGRVSDVILEELEQVGLTRLYLESEKWNGRGKWPHYATQRIRWAMLDWLRIEGCWTSRANGKAQREEAAAEMGWRDHPELPPARFCRLPTVNLGETDPDGGHMPSETIASGDPLPDEILFRKEESLMLRRLVAGMSDERQRKVISLRLEGLVLRDIAKAMDCSTGRVFQLNELGMAELRRTAKQQRLSRE